MFDFLFKKIDFGKQPRECHLGYKIAGVTFKNEDGTKRQDILKSLKAGDSLKLKEYTFENKKAIGVYTEDDRQIGNIQEEDIPYVLDKMKTMTKCSIGDIEYFSDGFGKNIYYSRVIVYFIEK